MLLTLLGVIALIQRERRKVTSTDSGRDEAVEQSDVPPVRSPEASLGQTSQHIPTDPAVLPTAEEPFTSQPEVDEDWSDESVIQDLVRDLSEQSADVLNGVVCKCTVDSFQTVPELSVDVPTTEEPVTGHPEAGLVNIPKASDSPTEDTVAPRSSQMKDNETTIMGVNSCSDEIGTELSEGTVSSDICMDDQVAMKFPPKKDIKWIYFEAYSEPPSSELQYSEDEETYGASNIEIKSHSEVPEVPVPADDTPEVPNKVLSGLSSRWKNWWARGIFTLAMLSGFFTSVYLGPMALMTIVLCIQIKCFHEIITIGYISYSVCHCYRLPWFRSLSWYFLLCVNYFFYGEMFTDYFFTLIQREEPIRLLSQYHRFISFALYLAGFCMFVLTLVKRQYRLQFYMFGWTHVTLMILVTQSHLIIRNLFEGMIWFIVPISCVICNDIMAYMFGFFFGRTPLITLSPKKTWEGFIGGFFSTVVCGIILSYMMAGYPYFVCPVEFNNHTSGFTVDCEPSEFFQLQDYGLPSVIQSITGWTTVKLYPFQIHSIALSSFASVMGPFGGFFGILVAGDFKSAFQIKDFTNTIPGHGDFMEHFDCQYLMATFVNVYIGNFIRELNPCEIIQ